MVGSPKNGDGEPERAIAQTELDRSADSLIRPALGQSSGSASQPIESLELLTTGTQVSDRFVIEWCVGTGGMGDVYRCRDLETNGAAALKIIRRIDDRSRFKREAAILAALSHDAIVRYLAHGTTETGTPFLAMEWLEGEDLAKVLNRSALSIADSVSLARRVCEGLALAHRHGFVHRDIKPSNLFVCQGSVANTKLLDFGVAHRGVTTQTSTRAGTMLGTVGYMAPEQAWGMPAPDPRDDLFSLGCVLFECLTGRPAFAGENSVAVLEAVLRSEPDDVRVFVPEVPAPLAELVRRLLRKDRKDRPPRCEHVLLALAALGDVRATASFAQRPIFSGEPARHAILVRARGLSCERGDPSLDALLQRVGAVPAGVRGEPCSFALLTQDDVTLVDVAERALQCARDLRALSAGVETYVAGPIYDAAAIPPAELADCAGRDVSPHAAVDPVTAALYRTRDESRREREPATQTAAPAPSDFLGRQAELTVLEAILAECSSDEVARAALLTGPIGSGKTRLIAEFASRLQRDAGVGLLLARAVHAERDTAQSFLRVLARAAQLAEGDDVVQTVTRAVEAACANAPFVLCIDDAQWIDVASLRVLASLLASQSERPLSIVAVARSSIRADLRAIWQSTGAQELALWPLSARVAEQLTELPAQLIAACEGNPRLLLALAGAAEQRETAVAVFADRVLELPSSERKVLCAASLFTARFQPAGVRAVMDPGAGVEADIAALSKRGFIVQLPATQVLPETEFTFVHEVIREAARRCLPESVQRSAGERAARWFAQTLAESAG